MARNHPNFGRELGIHVLNMYFDYDVETMRSEIEAIQNDYTCNNTFIRKLKLKLQRTEINNVIVRCVLHKAATY